MRELSALLRSNFEQETRTCKTPNVFSFATSELSQDAVLCYIFSWADDKYLEDDKGLCETAKSLLSRFTTISLNVIRKSPIMNTKVSGIYYLPISRQITNQIADLMKLNVSDMKSLPEPMF